MRIIFLYCENLNFIKNILNNIYIEESMLSILGDEYEELCYIFQNYYTKEFIANKIFNITYETIVYNIVDLVLNKYKVEIFMKMLHEGSSLSSLIYIDNRLLDMNLFSNNVIIAEKENVYHLVIKIINRYITTLVEKINKENNFHSNHLYDEIISIYTCLNEQLYSELDIRNFRLEFINNYTIMMIIY